MPTPALPFPSAIEVAGRTWTPAELVERLAPYVSDERRARIAAVVAARAYGVVPVLEGVHDLGNVNAVLRSAEGLGYGAVHLVALQGEAAVWMRRAAPGGVPAEGALVAGGIRRKQRQSQGADKWLDVHVWPDAPAAAAGLRAAGYRVVATHLGPGAVPLDALDFTVPTALVFGNERDGVSPAMLEAADLQAVLPIDGFVQSYNVSVAAALALYHARQDRLARLGRHGDLDAEARAALTARYYLRAVRHAERLLEAG